MLDGSSVLLTTFMHFRPRNERDPRRFKSRRRGRHALIHVSSTANAFVLRGAMPVFVDIRRDTLNLNETLIEVAITPRTRAICLVHYAGVACEMGAIMSIANRHGLLVIEDAAHALFGVVQETPGTFGQLAAISFHETKNVISGEGGALVVNAPSLVERAEIIWEKGTDRCNSTRRNRQIYLGRCRLLLFAERHHGGSSVRATRKDEGHHC